MKTLFPGKILLALVIFLTSAEVAYSQISEQNNVLRARHLSIRDGLSSNSIWSLFQDREGFMWVGTDAGIDKYDGYSFTHFLQDLPDSLDDEYNWSKGIIED